MMKLYLANGQYVGTQAEAKKIDREFEEVNVPTDKDGLIAYLNTVATSTHPALVREDEFETVVERQDPPVHTTPVADLDELFEAAPLARQLHFAALAVEAARVSIKPKAPSVEDMFA